MLNIHIFCQLLKLKRSTKGITQSEMADLIGISRSYYSEIEGSKVIPSIAVIQKISSLMPDIFFKSIVDNSDKVE